MHCLRQQEVRAQLVAKQPQRPHKRQHQQAAQPQPVRCNDQEHIDVFAETRVAGRERPSDGSDALSFQTRNALWVVAGNGGTPQLSYGLPQTQRTAQTVSLSWAPRNR